MARPSLELNLFSTEPNHNSAHKPPIFERRRSFRDIHGAISKINPEVVKSVIANASSLPSTPIMDPKKKFPPLPVCDPTLKLNSWYEGNAETAPLTIFYNGMVAVFDVSPQKAKEILKVAHEEGLSKSAESSDSISQNLLEILKGADFPLARRRSLRRFLEKRKERFTMVSPYKCPTKIYYPTPVRMRPPQNINYY